MIKLAYASFGQQPPDDVVYPGRALVWALSFGFVVVASIITVVLNFFAIFTGTLILFLGRPGVEFRFLRVFGSFPAIGLALPVLLSFAIWHEAQNRSVWWALAQVIGIWLLGAAALAFSAGWRLLTRSRQPR